MRIIVTTNDGEILDSVTVTADEFRRENNNPRSILSALHAGEDALNADDTKDED